MARVEQMDLSLRQIAPVGLGPGGKEMRVVAAPGGEQRRLMSPEIGLEIGVARDIATIVEDKVELDFVCA